MKDAKTRKPVLFIAMSVDGYIADGDGGVDWLCGQDSNSEDPDTYSEFAEDIDTVLMGWKTYHQIVTELSPDEWIYGDLTTYVLTHNECISNERIVFTNEDPVKLLTRLKQREGKDIWICGGANLAQQLMRAGAIDRYFISVIPTLLGGGARLFGDLAEEQRLELERTRNYNGIVELIYEPTDAPEDQCDIRDVA